MDGRKGWKRKEGGEGEEGDKRNLERRGNGRKQRKDPCPVRALFKFLIIRKCLQ